MIREQIGEDQVSIHTLREWHYMAWREKMGNRWAMPSDLERHQENGGVTKYTSSAEAGKG